MVKRSRENGAWSYLTEDICVKTTMACCVRQDVIAFIFQAFFALNENLAVVPRSKVSTHEAFPFPMDCLKFKTCVKINTKDENIDSIQLQKILRGAKVHKM